MFHVFLSKNQLGLDFTSERIYQTQNQNFFLIDYIKTLYMVREYLLKNTVFHL